MSIGIGIEKCLLQSALLVGHGNYWLSRQPEYVLLIYNIFLIQPWKCLESKGGPIQSLTLHDVTKFGSIDVISGDSRGTMTILSNGQILDRRHLSDHSINSLQVDEDLGEYLELFCIILKRSCIIKSQTFGDIPVRLRGFCGFQPSKHFACKLV